MPLTHPPTTPDTPAEWWAQASQGPLSFFGKTPTVTQPGAYSMGFATWDRALGPYTAAAKTTAYPGGVLNLLAAASVTELNDLRVAYENLRLFAEAVAKQHVALITDLKSLGLIG